MVEHGEEEEVAVVVEHGEEEEEEEEAEVEGKRRTCRGSSRRRIRRRAATKTKTTNTTINIMNMFFPFRVLPSDEDPTSCSQDLPTNVSKSGTLTRWHLWRRCKYSMSDPLP